MLKKKKQMEKQTVEPSNNKESVRDTLEQEYDSFAAPPTMGGPDHGLSVYIKLHQVLQYMAVLVEEVKGLRSDVNNEAGDSPTPVEKVNNEIY